MAVATWVLAAAAGGAADVPAAVPLPAGVRAVWEATAAYRDATPTRERLCINGLWRWQPAAAETATVPADGWGYLKVPGCWPGITDYMQKDSQVVWAHPAWREVRLDGLRAAWYEREVSVPAEWAGRRLVLYAEYVNSLATVFVDGAKVGAVRFPAGELDLTAACRPGRTHRLSLLVVALPLRDVMLSHGDTASVREVRGTVARRGLCGDVYLASTPVGARLAGVRVGTSVRTWEITFDVAFQGLAAGARYGLRARIADGERTVTEFASRPFGVDDVRDGRFAFTAGWHPPALWDTDTPANQYDVHLTLLDAGGAPADVLQPVRFGFREFCTQGRDFLLNGTRLTLSAVPFDNAQVGTAWATYAAARESLERLRGFGINFVYTHNYGCEPGAHLSFEEALRAADDLGMLVALSQPHFDHYDWDAPDADRSNGYAEHAAFYVRVAQNHPSVVLYATSHNATGYGEDMNPDRIDGVFRDTRSPWTVRNTAKALRAGAILERLDPTRVVYHHSSGNLGALYTCNFYANFAPIQEISDWFETWATRGATPAFLCEYGVPFTWDWAMYRGWYKGKREFGSARVPWEFCLAEWNASFLGDRAFQISDMERRNLRWEAGKFRSGAVWCRWDYPYQLGSADFPERDPVLAAYLTDNWRAFRTWGLSGISPWEYAILWRRRPGLERNRRTELATDWEHLQRPGFSPDYVEQRYERLDLAYERTDWVPTAGAEALLRNNRPLLAYIGGGPTQVTAKDHNLQAGETLEKQLVLINNSRRPVSCDCSWSLALTPAAGGRQTVSVEAGGQVRIPLRLALPAGLAAGPYPLRATAAFGTGETQADEFTVHVVPPRPAPPPAVRLALFDPKGETAALLDALGVPSRRVTATADLAEVDVLAIGKAALTVDGPAPDLGRVRDGLKVLVFEQTAAVLEKRLGFRVQEYGLRNVFARVPDHPVLAGLTTENLRDWRGAATLLEPRLRYETGDRFNGAPTVTWCDIPVTRAWRCGCRGNVASVLIEKPACGDFLPVVDGGFSLQYSPLLEYREGRGLVVFCQLDVTGRSEPDPAAARVAANLLGYVATWTPAPRRQAVYVGEPAGQAHLAATGLALVSLADGGLAPDRVLVLGPGAGAAAGDSRQAVTAFVLAGGAVLAVGASESDAAALLPGEVKMQSGEHISAFFDSAGMASPFAGVGPADVHNRDPRVLPLVSAGAQPLGNGVLAAVPGTHVVFCQLVPWQFDYRTNYGLKRTFRRVSYLVTRLLANLGASGSTPLLARFSTPVGAGEAAGRWLQGLYADTPEEMDDPYRFFRW